MSSQLVFSSVFSPCGKYLVCGAYSGRINIWKLDLVTADAQASLDFDAHSCPIYSLLFAGPLLISGSDEDIRGWSWEQLVAMASGDKTGSAPVPAFTLQHPREPGRRAVLPPLAETNDLAVDPQTGLLYSAAGDGIAYAWDLAAQTCTQQFKGHTDSLHCVGVRSTHQQLLTGSEDGSLRIWDIRAGKCADTVKPDKAASGSGAGWCSCLAVHKNEDWLVCGWGGCFLTTYSLGTMSCVAAMPTLGAPQAVCFGAPNDSTVMSVGAERYLYHWKLTGKLVQRVASTCSSVFSVAANPTQSTDQLVAVSGDTSSIDLYVDPSHVAMSLEFK